MPSSAAPTAAAGCGQCHSFRRKWVGNGSMIAMKDFRCRFPVPPGRSSAHALQIHRFPGMQLEFSHVHRQRRRRTASLTVKYYPPAVFPNSRRPHLRCIESSGPLSNPGGSYISLDTPTTATSPPRNITGYLASGNQCGRSLRFQCAGRAVYGNEYALRQLGSLESSGGTKLLGPMIFQIHPETARRSLLR